MIFEIYKDSRKKFRWRLRAKNNKVIADCAEAYNTKKPIIVTLMKFKGVKFKVVDKSDKPVMVYTIEADGSYSQFPPIPEAEAKRREEQYRKVIEVALETSRMKRVNVKES